MQVTDDAWDGDRNQGGVHADHPDEIAAACGLAVAEILTERLPARRLHAFPRAVKRKMSNFAAKRAHHRQWPRPTRPDAEAGSSSPEPAKLTGIASSVLRLKFFAEVL